MGCSCSQMKIGCNGHERRNLISFLGFFLFLFFGFSEPDKHMNASLPLSVCTCVSAEDALMFKTVSSGLIITAKYLQDHHQQSLNSLLERKQCTIQFLLKRKWSLYLDYRFRLAFALLKTNIRELERGLDEKQRYIDPLSFSLSLWALSLWPEFLLCK